MRYCMSRHEFLTLGLNNSIFYEIDGNINNN